MEEFIPIATITLAITAVFFIGVFAMLNRFKKMLNAEHKQREEDNRRLEQEILDVHQLFVEIKKILSK